MNPLQCPCCKQQAMSALAKLSVGPLRTTPCRACGQNLSVPWLPYVLVALGSSLLPFLGVVSAISLGVESMAVVLLCVLLSAAPALWLHYRCVPLVAGARAGAGRSV